MASVSPAKLLPPAVRMGLLCQHRVLPCLTCLSVGNMLNQQEHIPILGDVCGVHENVLYKSQCKS